MGFGFEWRTRTGLATEEPQGGEDERRGVEEEDEDDDDEVQPQPSVLRRGWAFLSECGRSALRDVALDVKTGWFRGGKRRQDRTVVVKHANHKRRTGNAKHQFGKSQQHPRVTQWGGARRPNPRLEAESSDDDDDDDDNDTLVSNVHVETGDAKRDDNRDSRATSRAMEGATDQKKANASRSGRKLKRPPRFESDSEDDEEQQDNDDAGTGSVRVPVEVAAIVTQTNVKKHDPQTPWPWTRFKDYRSEAEVESKYYPGFFDHPQDDDNEEEDEDDPIPSRHLSSWMLFEKRTATPGGTGRLQWYPATRFPRNDDLSEYALMGFLVAPNTSTKVKVRFLHLEEMSFDPYPARWGWWVSTYDGTNPNADYRLLEPDPMTPSDDGTDVPHLERRAMLAVLSSLLAVESPALGDHDDKVPTRDDPREVSLDPYLERVRAEGVDDPLPVLRLFVNWYPSYLQRKFLYTDGTPPRAVPLEALPLRTVPAAVLLETTLVLERIANIQPWGVPSSTLVPHKRKAEPKERGALAKKRMRIENGPPAFASVREVSVEVTESSENSVSSQLSDRPSELSSNSATTPSHSPTPSPLPSPKARRRSYLLSLPEFKDLFSDDELEDLEGNHQIRHGGDRTEHQYGRILPDAADFIFGLLGLSQNDAFLDFGSGIGSLVLQAAYTIGCPSRGIEIVKTRHDAALDLVKHTRTRIESMNMEGVISPGSVEFFNQNLISQEAVSVMNDAIRDATAPFRGGMIKAFVNNYEGLMGDRSPDARLGMSPENYIAGVFASWPPGSQLVSISPIRCLGMPVEQAISELRKHDLTAGNALHASFFTLDEMVLGPQNEVASWSFGSGCIKNVVAYRYRRIEQPDLHGNEIEWSRNDYQPDDPRLLWKPPVFLCCNPNCSLAQAGTPQPAIRLDDNRLPLVNTCSCSYQPKALRRAHEKYR